MQSLPNGKQALKYLFTTCEQDFPKAPREKKIMLTVLFIRRHCFLGYLTFVIFKCVRAFTGAKDNFLQDGKDRGGYTPGGCGVSRVHAQTQSSD